MVSAPARGGLPRAPAVLDVPAARRWALLTRSVFAARRDESDALNVLPVPDGDTGTNLYLTFDGAVERLLASAEALGNAIAAFDLAPLRPIELREPGIACDGRMDQCQIQAIAVRQHLAVERFAADDHHLRHVACRRQRRCDGIHHYGARRSIAGVARHHDIGAIRQRPPQ